MAKKLKIYFDTSILSFMWADDAPGERDVTRALFEEIRSNLYEAYISALVIEEITAAPDALRLRLEKLVVEYDLKITEITPEIESLANKYVINKIIPEKYGKDALHIAIATVNSLDAIISWNFKHIVNLKTHLEVNGINLIEGYRQIEIFSPWEVVGHGN